MACLGSRKTCTDQGRLAPWVRPKSSRYAHPSARFTHIDYSRGPTQNPDVRRKAPMKRIELILYVFLLMTVSAYCDPAIINLHTDNPSSLIGTRSTSYQIFGFRLGITHEQAWDIINSNKLLRGEINAEMPSRIYVYNRNANGSKGDPVLYLIWEPKEIYLWRIVVYQGCQNVLSSNFRRLLTFEALDDNSEFKKQFIGYANRTKNALDIPSINLKDTNYIYDDTGIVIVHQQTSRGNAVVFEIVKPLP